MKAKRVAAAGPVEGPWALPEGWRWERLGAVGRWGSGGTPKAKTPEYYGGHLPWYKIGDLTDGVLRGSADTITEAGLAASSAKVVPAGALLVAMYGSIGKLGMTSEPVTTNQAIAFCVPDMRTVDLQYLFYYLSFRRAHLLSLGQGGTQQNISQTILLDEPIALPELHYQERVVARIDELFSEIDEGEAALARARGDLATWRKALLKAAVTGELTADWRAGRLGEGDPSPDGPALLTRLLADRRARWEAEPKNRGKRYAEPAGPDTDALPDLPSGWVWVALGQLLDRIEAGLNVKCVERPPREDETGLLKISAVTWWQFNERASKTLADNHVHPEQWLIGNGDLLVSRANTLELVGAPAIVEDLSLRLMLSDKVLRLVMPPHLRRWTYYVMRSPYGRAWIESRSTGNQLSMRNISQDALRAMPIPLPPRQELDQIVDRLGLASTQHEELAGKIGTSDATAATLRQSILAAAFRGELA